MPSDERERIAQLIGFLTSLDAIRNPPVYDIADYRLYALREPDLPAYHDAVRLDPSTAEWLTVDFAALPPVPEVPLEFADLTCARWRRKCASFFP